MLILASGSPARRALLERAGIVHAVRPAAVDEETLKAEWRGAPVEKIAQRLADAKAQAGARGASEAVERSETIQSGTARPEAVVGVDTMVALSATHWIDKARDMDELRGQLLALRGKTHRLVTAAAVAIGGEIVWRHVAVAKMSVRRFSDKWLDHYLAAEGEVLLGSVGGYHVEGRGVQLFDRIDGDLFAVAGLPLVPLLVFLRGKGVLDG